MHDHIDIFLKYFLSFYLVSNNLTDYGRRHFKLFTNCHVSWDTLYIKQSDDYEHILNNIILLNFETRWKVSKQFSKEDRG